MSTTGQRGETASSNYCGEVENNESAQPPNIECVMFVCVCSLQVVLWSAIGPEGFYLFVFFYSAFLFLNANKDKTNSVLKSQLNEADSALLLLTTLSDGL